MNFIPFLTAGFPTPSLFQKLLFQLEQEGAATIEIGVPYSDPLADGPVIQSSSLRAVGMGINLQRTMDMIVEVREQGLKVPLILFSYYNPILQMGLDKFAKNLKSSGFNGVLVPDLPLEENMALKEALKPYQLPIISLIAPTSLNRIRKIAEQAEGFIYIVSSLGVTGERESFHNQIIDLIKEVKRTSNLPVVLGFGIKQRSQLKYFEKDLDGFIIGSGLIRAIQDIEGQLEQAGYNLDDTITYEAAFLDQFSSYIKEILL